MVRYMVVTWSEQQLFYEAASPTGAKLQAEAEGHEVKGVWRWVGDAWSIILGRA